MPPNAFYTKIPTCLLADFLQDWRIMYINSDRGVVLYCKCDQCDLEIGTWFFHATCRLDILNTCAILFENPSMHKEITAWTRKHAYKQ